MNQDETSTAAITASEESNSSAQAHGPSSSRVVRGRSEIEYEDNSSASDQANAKGSTKKKRADGRKIRRIMANRRSARESRERRKRLLEDLQDSIDKLAAENAEVAKANLAMRQELLRLLQESGLSAAFS